MEGRRKKDRRVGGALCPWFQYPPPRTVENNTFSASRDTNKLLSDVQTSCCREVQHVAGSHGEQRMNETLEAEHLPNPCGACGTEVGDTPNECFVESGKRFSMTLDDAAARLVHVV